MSNETAPRPDGTPLHTAFADFRAGLKTKQFPQENKEAFIGQITSAFEGLALQYFPVELGHFNKEGQTTIGSRYKDAKVEYKRTLNSMLGAVILTPSSEADIATSTDDMRYQLFTYNQKADKLSLENFQKVQRTMLEACKTEKDLGLLVTVLSMHDTPKLKTVADRIEAVTNVTSINHDRLLGEMVKKPELYQELAPNFARLDDDQREQAERVMTSAFNRGQLAQAECSPAQLLAVTRETMNDATNALIRAENTADLAGVTGNLGGIYTNYLHNMYRAADEAVDIVRSTDGTAGILPSYIHVLQQGLRRAEVDETLTPDDFYTPDGKRKIIIAKCTTASKADRQVYDEITTQFDRMGESFREPFTDLFTRTGLDGRDGVMFYYFPATLETSINKSRTEDPQGGLSYGVDTALRLLTRLSGLARDYLNGQIQQDQIEEVFSEVGVGIRGEQIDNIPEFVFGLDGVVKYLQAKLYPVRITGQPKEVRIEVE